MRGDEGDNEVKFDQSIQNYEEDIWEGTLFTFKHGDKRCVGRDVGSEKNYAI